MKYSRVMSAGMESIEVSAAEDPLLELAINGGYGEIISVEVGPSEGTDPISEVQELVLYTATGAGSGGTGLTEGVLRGEGTPVGVVTRNHTSTGAGLVEIYHTGYHTGVGWLYMPPADARPMLKAAGTNYFGVYFGTVPDASMTLSVTMVWAEVG